MKRLLAQLAQVWAVLLARVDVGPRQCRACHRTCTQIPRSSYDAWLHARHHNVGARLKCRCGGVLLAVGLDPTPTSPLSERP